MLQFSLITEFCFSKVLGTFEERLQIAKEYLKELDFVRKVDETIESFLKENEVIFVKYHKCLKDTREVNKLKDYVEVTK